MTILILERVPAKLRGELSRWLIEPRTGVFVGRVSALVRDRLWEKVVAAAAPGKAAASKRKPGALLIYRARTEQGFAVRSFGDPSREMVEMEGLVLVRVPHRAGAGASPEEGEGDGAVSAEEETGAE